MGQLTPPPPPWPKVDPYRRTTDSDSQSRAITEFSAGPWKCLHFFLIIVEYTHENLSYNKINATSLQIGVQSRNIKQGFGDCTCKQVERDQCELCRWKRKESIPLNPRLRPTNRAPSFGPIRYGMLRHLCHVMWSFKWLGVSRGERVLLDCLYSLHVCEKLCSCSSQIYLTPAVAVHLQMLHQSWPLKSFSSGANEGQTANMRRWF